MGMLLSARIYTLVIILMYVTFTIYTNGLSI